MLRPFTLHRPATVEAACALLAELGGDAVPYAGGTELLLLMKAGLLRPRHLVDLKPIVSAEAIVDDDGRLAVGAATTHRSLERSPVVRTRCAVLASAAQHVANVRVRNVGTVGGNLAFADPHSDLATLLLALDGRVELVSPGARRELAVDDFVRGPWETARRPDEILTRVTLAPPSADGDDGAAGVSHRSGPVRRTAAAYVKFGVHERPTLGIAVVLRLEVDGRGDARVAGARLAIGCVNPRPSRVPRAEARLSGCALGDLQAAGRVAAGLAAESADPADDLHGSADYKREMVAVFTRRAIEAAAARAGGGVPTARYPYAVLA